MHSLTALLAITGDWGRPQRRDFRNWPAGQRMEIEHLSIQMPCFANLLLIDIIRGCDYNKKWRFIRFHMKEKSMGYLSILETSKKWGVSKRRIQILCAEDRIPGATRIGNYWAIPDDAEKPKDARIKSGRYIKQKKSAE